MEKMRTDGGIMDRINDEVMALYLLSSMKGMLSDKLMRIYEYFGSFCDAYQYDAEYFAAAGLFKTDKMRESYSELKRNEERLIDRLKSFPEKGIRIVTMFDDDYPDRLKNINEMPPILYVRGCPPEDSRPSAAVIGSRKCSGYGELAAELIAGELSKNGVQCQ